jgi:uncharacterized protein (DUF736 family)
MPVIGKFSAVKDGYAGVIRTLTLNARVRIIANNKRDVNGAPDFKITNGKAVIGVAWRKLKSDNATSYLRVRLDDPALPQPIWGILLEATDDGIVRLLWRRDKPDDS